MAKYIDAEWISSRLANMADASKRLYPGLMTAYYQINAAPTANVRPERHGEWQFIDDGFYECSECGAFNDRVAGQIYCWKCGAKMDGKDNE